MYRATLPVQTFVCRWVYHCLNNKHVLALFKQSFRRMFQVESRTLLQKAFIMTVKTYLCQQSCASTNQHLCWRMHDRRHKCICIVSCLKRRPAQINSSHFNILK